MVGILGPQPVKNCTVATAVGPGIAIGTNRLKVTVAAPLLPGEDAG